MKNIVLLFTFALMLLSCSNNDANGTLEVTDYYGKWINIHNNKEVWSDQYVFNRDNTFTRIKTVNGVTTNLSGTFEIFTRDDRPNFQLTYSQPSNLIYSCSTGVGGNSELLYIYNGYLENAARMCDYELTYKKDK